VIKRDLERLRPSARPSTLAVMLQGYDLVKDRAGRRWVEDEITRRFPTSSQAARITIRRWGVSHPEPLPIDPPESRRAYYAALAEQAADWTERWPGSPVAWSRRLAALRQVKDVAAETLVGFGQAAMLAREQHPSDLELRPPLARQLASLLRDRGVALAEVPGLEAAPSPSPAPKGLSVTVDVSEAPDLAAWGAKAKALSERWYPTIGEILASSGYTPPGEVRLEFKKSLRVPALCHGTTIEINAEWVRKKPDDFGMVIHEITHVAQSLEGPGWLIEGVADYIRWHVFETPQLPKVDPAKASHEDGYRVTGAFLAWTATNYSKTLVRRLNVALRAGAYDDELFTVFTGKDLPTLWSEWLAAGAPAAMGPDALPPRS
jgi:hypothetical protein